MPRCRRRPQRPRRSVSWWTSSIGRRHRARTRALLRHTPLRDQYRRMRHVPSARARLQRRATLLGGRQWHADEAAHAASLQPRVGTNRSSGTDGPRRSKSRRSSRFATWTKWGCPATSRQRSCAPFRLYDQAFARAFPKSGVTMKNIATALAAFERTLVARNAPFDRYNAGDASALDDAARARQRSSSSDEPGARRATAARTSRTDSFTTPAWLATTSGGPPSIGSASSRCGRTRSFRCGGPSRHRDCATSR